MQDIGVGPLSSGLLKSFHQYVHDNTTVFLFGGVGAVGIAHVSPNYVYVCD